MIIFFPVLLFFLPTILVVWLLRMLWVPRMLWVLWMLRIFRLIANRGFCTFFILLTFRFIDFFIFFVVVGWTSSLAQSAFIFLIRLVLAWQLRISAQVVWNSWNDARTRGPRHIISQTFLSLLSCSWLLKTLSNNIALWKHLPRFACTKGVARPHSTCASRSCSFLWNFRGWSFILSEYSWTSTNRDRVSWLITRLLIQHWCLLFCRIRLILLRLFGLFKLIAIATRLSTSSTVLFHD